MSMFVKDDGKTRTYAIVDPGAQTVLGCFDWAGEAVKGKELLQKGVAGELAMHNLTHHKIPEWLQETLRSDPEYCAAKANSFDAEAVRLRRQAAKLVSEAEGYDSRASEWRELAAATEAPKPSM